MSVRTDVIGDNIRKRSSSVTETSKPISCLDTASLRTENKIYNINQTANNNLGRGRCDTFPTRTRESNDNVNQSFKSSHIQNIPCPVTHRPLALSRHSTSPPIASSFSSTERKESVKLDDQEESGNYLPFRFKSAERAIPEENSEDLINSDSINFQKDLYISMAPVVKSLDSVGNNIAQRERQAVLGDAAFSSGNNSKNSIVTTDLAPNLHAIIISSGKPNDFENEERPKRTYSIGSKIDKNKIKRLGNSNEILHDTNAVRVRAFSVGSRAKIPKCDLQRAVLFPRSRFNQSCNSNNSLNFGTEDAGYKFELNTNCDKKSTSAPILAQNGQVSVDCMSDLMEIDFSKSSIHKTHAKVVPVSGKSSDIYFNETKGYFTPKLDGELSQIPLKPINNEESGYLEMKPLNHETCTTNKSSLSHSDECGADMTKSSDITYISCVKRKDALLSSRENYQFDVKLPKNHTNHMKTKELDLILGEENLVSRKDHMEEIKFDNISNSENMTYLSCIYSQLSVQPTSKKIYDAEVERSISVVDNDKNIKTTKGTCPEEHSTKCILRDSIHGKSDTSKEASASSDRERKLPLSGKIDRNSNVPSLPPTSLSLSNASKLPSVSRFNDALTILTVIDSRDSENLLGNCTSDNKTPQITAPTSLTPCSSYELYYAKLDLPQCSTKDNMKFQKTENASSPIMNAENDSYAKIDFDHSSDSSSSSKTLNN